MGKKLHINNYLLEIVLIIFGTPVQLFFRANQISTMNIIIILFFCVAA